MKEIRGTGVVAALLVTLSLAACSKLDVAHYDRLKVGQSYDEVVGVLGKPDRCDEMLGMRKCQWGNENRYIRVTFAGNNVLTLVAHNIK